METFGTNFLDVDGVAALDRYVGEFVVLDLHILVLADRVAFDLLLGRNFFLRDRIHHLALQAIAGSAVQGVEADLLRGRCRRIDRDGRGDEGELEVALPIRAGCHG